MEAVFSWGVTRALSVSEASATIAAGFSGINNGLFGILANHDGSRRRCGGETFRVPGWGEDGVRLPGWAGVFALNGQVLA